jgi:hypothetical protein
MTRDISDVRAELGAAGLDEGERIAEAQERMKQEVAEAWAEEPDQPE